MNELMQDSSESPDVTAELARLIKSGLTYSQLYHKYHKTTEELLLTKAENSRINSSFDALVQVSMQSDQLMTILQSLNGQ